MLDPGVTLRSKGELLFCSLYGPLPSGSVSSSWDCTGDKWYKTSLELAWLRAAGSLFPEKAVPVSLEMPLFLVECGNNPLAHVFHSR